MPLRDAIAEGRVMNGEVMVWNTEPQKESTRLVPIWERDPPKETA